MPQINKFYRILMEDKWINSKSLEGVENRRIYIPNIRSLSPDPQVQVMNWDGDKGILEFAGAARGNESFTDLTPWFPIIEEYDRLVEEIEAEPPPVPLDDYKTAAKSRIYQYYVAYTNSQFTVGPSTFGASSEKVQTYLLINELVKETPGSVDYFIVDILNEPFPITSAGIWTSIWTAYKQLFREATAATRGAWPAVQAATSLAEVDAVFDALPPIPGTE